MKFIIPTFLVFLIPISINAQTGIVNYGEIQSMGMGSSVGPDYNAILVFDTSNSLYITRKDSLEGGHILEQRNFEHTDGNGSSITVVTNPEGFLYYYNSHHKILYSRDLGFKYIKDKTIAIPWKIQDTTKKIGDYTVQKATAFFRGRNYTAWFTTKIPLPYGPWKLSGLPGLILEAYDTDKEIYWYFKNIEYPSKKSYLLKPIKAPNDIWMTFEDFKKFSIKTYLDAQVSGRMIAESAGYSNNDEYEMSKSRIEAFKIEEN
ncbi:GLPGLI family protein [Leeuwenhoekiella sp. A16]|uniref:GLPGLI family protein n=1 Tax=unclassified Leeuwenhoekiella TaxID=2615029 RepID=UPI003A7F6C8E|tara:strand:- start:509 stop:1291 length:783 start_codon:yes stop_codon:yes gene_type:complete